MQMARDELPGPVPRIAFAQGPAPLKGGDAMQPRDGEPWVLVARLIQERMPQIRFDVDRRAGMPNELRRAMSESGSQEALDRSLAEES